jgi:MYXO-CTERM domain-containing protein
MSNHICRTGPARPLRGPRRNVVPHASTGWACLSLIAVVVTPAQAAYETMVDNGPSSNRVDVVFLGDGYTAPQLSTVYPAHVNGMLAHLFDHGEDPYPRYRNFFNVHRVDVVSNQSGADVPPLGVFRDTALDAKYFYDGATDRLLYVNTTKANAALASGLAGAPFGAEVKLVTVNDARYGGGGGAYAVYAGGNGSAAEIALHEMGHSFNGLADEYGGNVSAYSGGEPGEPNVSRDPTGAKWSHWVGYNQPVIGTIGAYEGGRYHDRGIYRPSNNSKMRSLGRPFDAVSREQIILDIYDLVDPLDAFTDNAATLVNPDVLAVDTVDADVIGVEWSIDGVPLPQTIGEALDVATLDLVNGLYTITARAFDPTDWVRTHLDRLEQTVTWSVLVSTPEPGGAAFAVVAVAAITRRRRRRP